MKNAVESVETQHPFALNASFASIGRDDLDETLGADMHPRQDPLSPVESHTG
jgi:hypothetical protein